MSKVYVRLDENGLILDCNSDKYLADLIGWNLLSEGTGIRFDNPQCYYFEPFFWDANGFSNYKIANGIVTECTTADKQNQKLAWEKFALPPSSNEQIKLLKAQVKAQSDRNDFMEDCIAEIGTIVYK